MDIVHHTRRASPSKFTIMRKYDCNQRRGYATCREAACPQRSMNFARCTLQLKGRHSGAILRILHVGPKQALRITKRHLAESSIGSKSDDELLQI